MVQEAMTCAWKREMFIASFSLATQTFFHDARKSRLYHPGHQPSETTNFRPALFEPGEIIAT